MERSLVGDDKFRIGLIHFRRYMKEMALKTMACLRRDEGTKA